MNEEKETNSKRTYELSDDLKINLFNSINNLVEKNYAEGNYSDVKMTESIKNKIIKEVNDDIKKFNSK